MTRMSTLRQPALDAFIVLVNLGATPGQAARDRFLEVCLGIVVALAVTLLIFRPPLPKHGLKTA